MFRFNFMVNFVTLYKNFPGTQNFLVATLTFLVLCRVVSQITSFLDFRC